MVIGEQPTVHARADSEDLKTNRNSKMVKILMRPDVNGMFLFCLVKNSEMVGTEFLMPPGLSDDASKQFQREFMQLFEKYAKLANGKH